MGHNKWFRDVGLSAVVLLAGFVVPVAWVTVPFWGRLSWEPTFRSLLPLGLAIGFLSVVLRYQLDQANLERRPELQSFLDFVLWSGKQAVLVAAVFGALVLLFYFSVPYDPSRNSVTYRLGEALGLYVGVAGLLIGLQFLYWQDHAITDYQQLLSAMTNDLKLARRNRAPMFLVFMAPNIGYFRALDDFLRQRPGHNRTNGLAWTRVAHDDVGGLYEQFHKEALIAARESTIVCHKGKHFKELYTAYCTQAGIDSDDTDYFTFNCAAEAKALLKSFRNHGRNVVELAPEDFPREIVVIGPVCYLLFPHGLPVWKQSESKYERSPDSTTGGLASLVAYRREDRILAQVIKERIQQLET